MINIKFLLANYLSVKQKNKQLKEVILIISGIISLKEVKIYKILMYINVYYFLIFQKLFHAQTQANKLR